MKRLLALMALAVCVANAQPDASPTNIPKQVMKIISRADGKSPETAFKVGSVREEYEVLMALGLTPKSQALVVKKKPYDLLTAIDPSTGSEREVWFDISSFYPEF